MCHSQLQLVNHLQHSQASLILRNTEFAPFQVSKWSCEHLYFCFTSCDRTRNRRCFCLPETQSSHMGNAFEYLSCIRRASVAQTLPEILNRPVQLASCRASDFSKIIDIADRHHTGSMQVSMMCRTELARSVWACMNTSVASKHNWNADRQCFRFQN